MKMKFNQLGAMLLEKQIRALSSYLSGSSTWATREKFSKLNQICTLLNLEKLHEIYDYWEDRSAALSWRLTVPEVKDVLALRVDFRQEDINKLKL